MEQYNHKTLDNQPTIILHFDGEKFQWLWLIKYRLSIALCAQPLVWKD